MVHFLVSNYRVTPDLAKRQVRSLQVPFLASVTEKQNTLQMKQFTRFDLKLLLAQFSNMNVRHYGPLANCALLINPPKIIKIFCIISVAGNNKDYLDIVEC